LIAVIHEPCLRPDGTIVDEPGYDAQTGLLLIPRFGAKKIQERAYPQTDDEMRMVITSVAMAGRRLTLFDNIAAPWAVHRSTPRSREQRGKTGCWGRT